MDILHVEINVQSRFYGKLPFKKNHFYGKQVLDASHGYDNAKNEYL